VDLDIHGIADAANHCAVSSESAAAAAAYHVVQLARGVGYDRWNMDLLVECTGIVGGSSEMRWQAARIFDVIYD